jgi:hypothetical protein
VEFGSDDVSYKLCYSADSQEALQRSKNMLVDCGRVGRVSVIREVTGVGTETTR